MGLLEDFAGTPYAKSSLALYNSDDGMRLYDHFKHKFPQKENSRCLALAIWIHILNDPRYPKTTYREIAGILSKGSFAIDRAKITKEACREASNCKQNHPVFHLNAEETPIFVSLMNDKPPMVCMGTTCNHLQWDAIIERNNLGLPDLQRLHGTCNFDITKYDRLKHVWKIAEESLIQYKKEFKENPTQNLLTKIGRLYDAFIWIANMDNLHNPIEDMLICTRDEDVFERVSGMSFSYTNDQLSILISDADGELETGASVLTKRLIKFVEAGIINHTTGYRTYTNRDLPFLVELIRLRKFRALVLMFSLGASPYIQDCMGINLYTAVKQNQWWTHKYKTKKGLGPKAIFYNVDDKTTSKLLGVIEKYKNRWTPQTHFGFTPMFRSQVKTLLLVNNRLDHLRLPRDIITMIFQYMAANQDTMDHGDTMAFLKMHIINAYAKSYPQSDFKYYFNKFGYKTMRVPSRSESAQILVDNAYPNIPNEYIDELTGKIEAYVVKHKNTSAETLKHRIFRRGGREIWVEKLALHAGIMKYIPMQVLKKYINYRSEAPLKRRKV